MNEAVADFSLSSLKCVDVNECQEGKGRNGDLGNVCTAAQPCCSNLVNSGFICRPKRGVLLVRNCPPNSVDLSPYIPLN